MRILFICPDNGARSQMAEALARHLLGASAEITSAGLESGNIGLLTGQIMLEIGIDISPQKPKRLTAADLNHVDLLITVCEKDLGREIVDTFVGDTAQKSLQKLHWPLVDPHDPPASAGELKLRLRDTRQALDKHIRALKTLKLRRSA